MENVITIDHPLMAHKIAKLRDKNTDPKMFREYVEEITTLLTYEAFKDIPTVEVDVETPLQVTKQRIVEHEVAIIPILRAGLGMVNGVHALFPIARVGHIGMFRNEETLQPELYYCKLPEGIEDMTAVILDPMLATGGCCVAAIDLLKSRGVKQIKCFHVIAAPEGIAVVHNAHPDVQMYCASVDQGFCRLVV